MSRRASFDSQSVRSLIDAIIDRARSSNDDVRLTVVVGSEAVRSLMKTDDIAEPCDAATPLYRGAVVTVVPTLQRWLVMVVPMISGLAPEIGDPTSFYGDLRTNTFGSSLPPQA